MAMQPDQEPRKAAVGLLGPMSNAPELPVALFSFLLHFVWEFLQVPTYSGMAEMAHWQGIRLCTAATIGDVGFALTAFWAASLAARTRHWIGSRAALPYLVFIASGIALTVGFEFYYTQVTQRWTYSDLMPLVPPFGTGLSPLVQWVVIPPTVIWLSRRHLAGTGAGGDRA
ncbi:MAG: hypothetical protein WBA44_05505 [Mesorhizobium sp.]